MVCPTAGLELTGGCESIGAESGLDDTDVERLEECDEEVLGIWYLLLVKLNIFIFKDGEVAIGSNESGRPTIAFAPWRRWKID